jgi:glyoxylase-like metal-dependent hydrolase (beta-lactamase superfamily II)/8-oxo-dGTP pyrophosphatase MutT (NUDIX family)
MEAPLRKKFRESAVVVLVRGEGESLETYWVKRSDAVAIQPGFMSFVGGKVDPEDATLDLPGIADDAERAACACAIREALEEVGVLVGLAPGVPAPPASTLATARTLLLEKRATLAGLAAEHGWRFAPGSLQTAGHWQTPPFAPVRFETLYFLTRVPEGQSPSVQPGELASGEWIRPADALARWKTGEHTFVAPILWALRSMQEGGPDLAARLADAPRRAATPARQIEMQYGVVLHAMKTRPLPPASHTNAYFIGESEMALVDPGSGEPEALEELFRVADALAEQGRRVKTIVVTHHHPDHTGGVAACRERFRAPVAGHIALAPHLTLDLVVGDGDTIALAPGVGEWDLTVLATPGHTRDSISLWHARNRLLFCGDLVPGGPGSVVIDPPDGDMGGYLASLERMAALDPRVLFPAHGSPQGAVARRIRALAKHRREREALVVAALTETPQSLAELLPRVYEGTPKELWAWAERSLLAHLLWLESRGAAARDSERWRRP